MNCGRFLSGSELQLSEKLPSHNSETDRNVQRVLGPLLRNFQRNIGECNGFIADAMDFMAKNQTILPIFYGRKFLKRCAVRRLLHRDDFISGSL